MADQDAKRVCEKDKMIRAHRLCVDEKSNDNVKAPMLEIIAREFLTV